MRKVGPMYVSKNTRNLVTGQGRKIISKKTRSSSSFSVESVAMGESGHLDESKELVCCEVAAQILIRR